MRSRAASALRMATMTTAGVAAALVAVGCSSGGGSSSQPRGSGMSPARAITLASQQAASVNSFASTLSEQISGPVTATLAGRVQLRNRPSVLVDADFSTLKADGQTEPGGMQEILTGKTLYLKLAALQRRLGKPWGALPLSELSQSTGVNLSQLTQQVQQNNPMTDAQMLTSAKNLRSVGTQAIDGVSATHYTGSFPVSAGLAKLPPSLRTAEQRALQKLGISTISFSAWIDTQHRIRKIALTEHGSSAQVTATMQITAFNQPVTVTLPPASQVKTIPSSALRS
jgi:hypothetical protein